MGLDHPLQPLSSLAPPAPTPVSLWEHSSEVRDPLGWCLSRGILVNFTEIPSETSKDALCFLRSSFEEAEALVNTGAKIQHPVTRGLAPNQEPHLQVPEKSSQKELEAMTLGTASDAIEIVSGVGGA